MSTRGCIARLTSKPGKKIKFKGVYHHSDSYVEGLGASLFELRNGFFKGDTEAMLKKLIDEHPAGWSTINGADFNIPAGFVETCPYKLEMNEKEKQTYELYQKTPRCYCHGDRHSEANPITQKDASDCGCEYVYAFTADGQIMLVLSSYCENGEKMVGCFGYGDPDAEWKVIGEIYLDRTEPTEEQWKAIPIQQKKETTPEEFIKDITK